MDSVDITTIEGVLRIEYNLDLLKGDRKDRYKEHNNFFEEFTKLWRHLITVGRHRDAEKVWDKALEIASAYEAEHKNSIHKGTPYYFWGGTCILSGDLDKGFLLMHQALDEDKKTLGDVKSKETPAYAFVKMDDKKVNQFFRGKVMEGAEFVKGRLLCYRTSRDKTLDIDGLRTKVLKNDGLRDVSFFLVYNFFRLKKLLDAKKEIRQNDFASLLQAQTILSFCIVAEELFKKAQEAFSHRRRPADTLRLQE